MKRDERSLGHGTTSRADLGMVKGGGKGVGGGVYIAVYVIIPTWFLYYS